MADINKFFMSFMKEDQPASLLKYIPELSSIIGFPQMNKYHVYDVWTHTMMALYVSEGDYITNLAILFHDIGKPEALSFDDRGMHFHGHSAHSVKIAEPILKRITDDQYVVQSVLQLIKYHDIYIIENKKFIRRLYLKLGNDQMKRLLELRRCDVIAQNPKYLKERLDKISRVHLIIDDIVSHDKNSVKLAINGNDLLTKGFKEGPRIGEILDELRRRVKEGTCPNQKDSLLSESVKIHMRLNLENFLSAMEDTFNKPDIKEKLDTLYELQKWLNEHPDVAEEIDKKTEEMIKNEC